MKKPDIMVVCMFGLGSSTLLKLTLEKVLKAEGLEAKVFCADESTARGYKYDMVFTSNGLAKLFKDIEKPVVIISNFLSQEEIREKGLALVRSVIEAKAK